LARCGDRDARRDTSNRGGAPPHASRRIGMGISDSTRVRIFRAQLAVARAVSCSFGTAVNPSLEAASKTSLFLTLPNEHDTARTPGRRWCSRVASEARSAAQEFSAGPCETSELYSSRQNDRRLSTRRSARRAQHLAAKRTLSIAAARAITRIHATVEQRSAPCERTARAARGDEQAETGAGRSKLRSIR
jgi:hypothetical protein